MAEAIDSMKKSFSSKKEGPVAKRIEQQTAKLPSDVFLWAALSAMAVSAAIELQERKNFALFFGQWAPSLLILGLYNKVVKQLGSSREDRREDVAA